MLPDEASLCRYRRRAFSKSDQIGDVPVPWLPANASALDQNRPPMGVVLRVSKFSAFALP